MKILFCLIFGLIFGEIELVDERPTIEQYNELKGLVIELSNKVENQTPIWFNANQAREHFYVILLPYFKEIFTP